MLLIMNSVRRLAIALLLVAASAGAATKTWTGAVNNRWSVGGNWSGGTPPVNGDALVFGGANTNLQNDIAGTLAVDSMTFTGGVDYSLDGNPIALANGVSAPCCGGDFLTLTLPITLTASQTFDGGNRSFYVAGPVNLNGFTLQFAPNGVAFTGSLSGSGNVIFANSAYFPGSSTAAGTITVSGPLQFTGNVTNTQLTKNGSIMQAVNTLADVALHGTALQISHAIGIPGGYGGPDILHTGNLLIDHGSVSFSAPGQQIIANGSVTLTTPALDLGISPLVVHPGQSITLIDNDGVDPVQGTFLNLPEGAIFNSGSVQYRISYSGGTGNDVVVTVLGINSIPAMSDALLLLLGAVLVIVGVRKL